MFEEEDFEDIRPYNDEEINPALNRLISNPLFDKLPEYFFPDTDPELLKRKLSNIHSSHAFQAEFMLPLANSILEKTSEGLTFEGIDNISATKPYLFVANHRDIVLDSTLLQMYLLTRGHRTTEITFGSNLMKGDFVVDLGKINKMFKLERADNKMELLSISHKISAYIRHRIVNKNTSIWIAQRPGRTKNGHDKTEPGLLKMFNMSRKGSFLHSFSELNIVPVTISYEYEPCCGFKIKELIETERTGSYCKRPDEDLQSIIRGITQQKGRIHLAIGEPVNSMLAEADSEPSLNKKLCRLANIIDYQIYRDCRLWPGNYIASDMLRRKNEFAKYYNDHEKTIFLDYMEKEIMDIDGDKDKIIGVFLNIYANPVFNSLNSGLGPVS